MTPAEELKAAAKLMRERAEAASILWPGPWSVVEDGTPRVPWVMSPEGGVIAPAYLVVCEHIASMHPLIALAVADWLDEEAEDYESFDAETQAFRAGDRGGDLDGAIATARAYLGSEREAAQ